MTGRAVDPTGAVPRRPSRAAPAPASEPLPGSGSGPVSRRRCPGYPIHALFDRRLAFAPGLGLEGRLGPASRGGSADLVVDLAPAPPAEWRAGGEIDREWESPERGPEGRPLVRLQRRGGVWRLRFRSAGDYFVTAERVVQVPTPGACPKLARLRLLGPVVAFWLELQGVVTLHASAVAVATPGAGSGSRTVAFLAGHGAGKSSLAAAWLAHSDGAGLVTDDLLALRPGGAGYDVLPSYPYMRLWPADAERWTGTADGWPRVLPATEKRRVTVGQGGFGRLHPWPAPLAALLLPERRPAGAVGLERLSPAAALYHLVDTSYLRRLVTGAGLQPGRLERLAELVERVPVSRLLYPQGPAHLPRVAAAVRRAVAG